LPVSLSFCCRDPKARVRKFARKWRREAARRSSQRLAQMEQGGSEAKQSTEDGAASSETERTTPNTTDGQSGGEDEGGSASDVPEASNMHYLPQRTFSIKSLPTGTCVLAQGYCINSVLDGRNAVVGGPAPGAS
jgi:hypothetical protein